MRRRQVAIVGGGPVGLALALDLALRGVSCAVVERRAGPRRVPRGQNLAQRTLEHFHFWGAEDALRAARVLPAGFPSNFVVAHGDLASRHWHASPARETVDGYYFRRGERLPQYLTERVLEDRLRAAGGAEIRRGWSVASIREDADGVALALAEEGGAGRDALRADHAVGCDGVRSLVRESLGVASDGTDHAREMVLAVFRSRELHERLKRFPPAYVYRVVRGDLRGYWRFFGRVDDRERWFFHAPVPAGLGRGEDGIRRLLRESAGFPFACAFDHLGFWDLRTSVAGGFRSGRVFLAGDAAHSHPPYGGFGLNSGFEDAANLGWKLAAVLGGWGGEALLRSYDAERRPVAADTAARFIDERIAADRAFFERFDPDRDPAAFADAWKSYGAEAGSRIMTYAPRYEASPVIDGPPGGTTAAVGEHGFRALPGRVLPPARRPGGGHVHEALGRDFSLLALGAGDEAVAALAAAARRRRVPLRVVRDRREGECARYGARLVLVRPDRYVAWRGDAAPADADALMRKAAGAGRRQGLPSASRPMAAT